MYRRTMRTRRLQGDDGYVLAMAGLLIVPLVVMTALAVDVGAWYAQATRMQRTADAAALAGVPMMPNFAAARVAALSVTQRNGYADSSVTVANDPLYPNRLRVSIDGEGDRYFSGAGGVKKQMLSRFAVAEFNRNLQMGSPINFLGKDPDVDPDNLAARSGAQQPMWLNTSGYMSPKSSGDQFTSSNCSGSTSSIIAPCNGSGPGSNPEFSPDGYYYLVDVTAPHGPLDIQVYDPSAVHMGDYCDRNNLVALGTKTDPNAPINRLVTAYTNNGLVGTGPGKVSDPVHRWGNFHATASATVPTSWNAADLSKGQSYCNGTWVNDSGTATGGPTNVKTTWIVRAPDATPYVYNDNRPICAITFDSYNLNVQNLLDPSLNADWNVGANSTEKVAFWKHFRQWFTLCRIDNPVAGKYEVQVRHNADMTNSPSPTTTATSGNGGVAMNLGSWGNASTAFTTAAHHRYSLRAGWRNSQPASPTAYSGSVFNVASWMQDVDLFAESHLPVYANTPGATGPQFYLARVTPEYRGAKIRLSLWDIGDGADATLTIIPPSDRTGSGIGCTWTRDGGLFPGTATGCTASGLSSTNFNGHTTDVTLQIPA